MNKAIKALLAVLLVAVVVLLVIRPWKQEPPDVTAPGIAYLEALEKKDPDAVLEVLRQRRQDELKALREELLRQIRDGEADPFTQFQDSVIMGDSRAEGFWYFGFVDKTRTLTGAGHTILDITKQLDQLEAMNPQYIYMTYGLNDLKIGIWGNSERFAAEYMEAVGKVRERLPDAVIVVSSILPVREKLYEDAAKKLDDPEFTAKLTLEEKLEWQGLRRTREIPAWNTVLAAACAEHNVIFCDGTAVSQANMNLWEGDCIHMKQRFYPHWARELILAALEEGGTHNENIDP